MTTLIPKIDLKNGGSTPAGAINRPFNEKLAEIVSVKDFGAIGDGTTNDTSAFDSAIAAASINKQTIFIPAGTYLVDRIDLQSNVSLLGEPGSVLKRNDNIILGIAYDAATVDNVRIENIAFEFC